MTKSLSNQFYPPDFLLSEISKHWEKLKSISKLEEDILSFIQNKINQNIRFISYNLISDSNYKSAYALLKEVDEQDVPFLALSLELDSKIWTGDKKFLKIIEENFPEKIINIDNLI